MYTKPYCVQYLPFCTEKCPLLVIFDALFPLPLSYRLEKISRSFYRQSTEEG